MSRLARNKHRFTTGEKWLFAAPLALILAAVIFFAIKRATSPRFIATELQVTRVVWLGNNKIFTLQREETKGGATTFPVSVIYDIQTGEKLAERAWTTRTINSRISPDGRFWLAGETNDGRNITSLVLRDLHDFSTVAILPTTTSSEAYDWMDTRHFTRLGWNGKTSEQSLWKVDEKTGSVAKVKSLDKNSRFVPISAEGMKVIKTVYGKYETRRFRSVDNVSASYGFTAAKSYLTSLPDEKEVTLLTNVADSRDKWGYDGQSLWRMVCLNYIPVRCDLLKYDLKTRKTTSIRLKDTEKAFPQYNLSYSDNDFSPGCRLWCASASNGQKWAFWDTQTGELVKTIGEVSSVPADNYRATTKPQFSNDGRYFFRPMKNGIEIYDTSRFLP